MSVRIRAYPGGIAGFSKDFGWSTRINQLLAGKQPWTLEDIHAVCTAFEFNPVEYLGDIRDGCIAANGEAEASPS